MQTQYQAKISLSWFLIVALTSVSLTPPVAWAGKKAKPLPEFSKVEEVVKRHFDAMADYETGDLISAADVKPLFKQLRMMGWRIRDRAQIESLLPNESSYVTRQLRTTRGVKFMRKISGDPDGYERLYQLASLPNGSRLVHDLIHGKGGHEMIDYMTTSKGGKNMTKMLAKTPGGKEFRKPTKRIFTVDQLIERLQESHTAAKEALAEKGEKEALAVKD